MKFPYKPLTLLAAILCMASCSNKSAYTNETMMGAYGKYTALTADDDSLFRAVMASHQELKLTPVKVSHQVVEGMNHCFECIDSDKKKVEIVIYEPLPGNGNARLTEVNGKAVE
ncbi:MAG: hypothetical protein ACI308_08155 [Muribaculaceae bacterium]